MLGITCATADTVPIALAICPNAYQYQLMEFSRTFIYCSGWPPPFTHITIECGKNAEKMEAIPREKAPRHVKLLNIFVEADKPTRPAIDIGN